MTSERKWEWVDWMANCLIHQAARHAPDSLSERLEEEWLADSVARCRPLSRLRFAIGCCWASKVIAWEHPLPAHSASTSPIVHRHLVHFAHDEFPFFTGGAASFVLVVSLHAAVLYGLAAGSGPKFSQSIVAPIMIQVVD
jgi:hypothetical protein